MSQPILPVITVTGTAAKWDGSPRVGIVVFGVANVEQAVIDGVAVRTSVSTRTQYDGSWSMRVVKAPGVEYKIGASGHVPWMVIKTDGHAAGTTVEYRSLTPLDPGTGLQPFPVIPSGGYDDRDLKKQVVDGDAATLLAAKQYADSRSGMDISGLATKAQMNDGDAATLVVAKQYIDSRPGPDLSGLATQGALDAALSFEANSRHDADESLSSVLSAETADRQAADQALTNTFTIEAASFRASLQTMTDALATKASVDHTHTGITLVNSGETVVLPADGPDTRGFYATGSATIGSQFVSAGLWIAWRRPDTGAWTVQAPGTGGGTTVPVDPADTTAPSVPTGLVATPGSDSITVTWTASTDNVGVAGYEAKMGAGAWVDSGPDLSHTFTGLAAGSIHSGQIRSYDGKGNRSSGAAWGPTTTKVPSLVEQITAMNPLVLLDFGNIDSGTSAMPDLAGGQWSVRDGVLNSGPALMTGDTSCWEMDGSGTWMRRILDTPHTSPTGVITQITISDRSLGTSGGVVGFSSNPNGSLVSNIGGAGWDENLSYVDNAYHPRLTITTARQDNSRDSWTDNGPRADPGGVSQFNGNPATQFLINAWEFGPRNGRGRLALLAVVERDLTTEERASLFAAFQQVKISP